MTNFLKVIIGITIMSFFSIFGKAQEPLGELSKKSYPPPSFITQPIYEVTVESNNINITLSINNVPAYQYNRNEAGPGAIASRAIGPYMVNGWNIISVDIEPVKAFDSFPEATDFKVSLTTHDAKDDWEKYLIALIEFNGRSNLGADRWQKGIPYGQEAGIFSRLNQVKQSEEDIEFEQDRLYYQVSDAEISSSKVYSEGVRISRKFRTNLNNLPQWKWLTSDVITQNEATYQSLLEALHEIYTWTKNDNSEMLATLPLEANMEIKRSFYEPTPSYDELVSMAKSRYREKSFLSGLYNKFPNAQLVKWNPSNYDLKIYGDGRLAEIVELIEGEGYRSPIRWKVQDENGNRAIESRYIFRKDGSKWIKTRY